MPADKSTTTRRIALALQGGGSHGAFTWGVLDRLLQDSSLDVDIVSGTSAGAMNAVVLADGLVKGGPGEARRALRAFWEAIGRMPGLATWFAPFLHQRTGGWQLDDSPAYAWFDMVSRLWSPYDLNPHNFHPLRDLIAHTVDFKRLRAQRAVRAMVCATNVRTGRRRVFQTPELSTDAVLASACLPFLFPAVEIEGEPYWDGGYTGNPAITPIYVESTVVDLIIVGINPRVRQEVPRTARDIINRVNEISFNSTYWLELAAIALLTRLGDEGALDRARVRQMYFHAIDSGDQLGSLGASSKLNNHPDFLQYLFGIGRTAADTWLRDHGSAVGQRTSLDLSGLLSPHLSTPT